MEFKDFPFDSHECEIYMVNWLGASYRVRLNRPKIYTFDPLSGTEIGGYEFNKTTGKVNYDFTFKSMESADFFENGVNYTMSKIRIEFKRNGKGKAKIFSGYHISSVIFALLSLVSYLIDSDQVPGRMGLLITLSLIMINSYNSADAPSNRGFSSIEIWFIGTLTPVLFGIAEFGSLLAIKKFRPSKTFAFGDKELSSQEFMRIVDFISLMFMLSFLIVFNLVYWLAY